MLLLLAVVGSAHAHIPLTPEILNDALDELEDAQAKAETEKNKSKQAAAIYDIALTANGLMNLLNEEVQLQGFSQQSLLDWELPRQPTSVLRSAGQKNTSATSTRAKRSGATSK